MIEIRHNLEKEKFKWLWSKYVVDGNDKYHCTNSLKGKYSKNLVNIMRILIMKK